jgi:hypothetical protein
MGPNHSFLGFVKCTLRDCPKDELTSTSICYPPQACVKIKRYSPEMVGEILGKGYAFVFVLMAVSVALEHDTPCSSFESGLGNPFVSHLTSYKVISWVVFESMLSRPLSCRSYVQEKSKQALH